jgi:thioredoxin-like negative regulator of GroEL
VPEIRYHLAVALNKQGRLDEALTELTQALNSARDFDGKDDAIRLRAELGG